MPGASQKERLKNSTAHAPLIIVTTSKPIWVELPADTDKTKVPRFARFQSVAREHVVIEFGPKTTVEVWNGVIKVKVDGDEYIADRSHVLAVWNAGIGGACIWSASKETKGRPASPFEPPPKHGTQ